MKMNKNKTNKTQDVLWRGIKGDCPNCGQGNLFKSYITQNKICSVCHEDFSDIRADDAPPWLTILITGHIMAPFIFYFVTHDVFPDVVETTILIIIALLCVFLILPRAKGLFIAAIWLTRNKKDSD